MINNFIEVLLDEAAIHGIPLRKSHIYTLIIFYHSFK